MNKQEIIKQINIGIDQISKRQEICLNSVRYDKLESFKDGLYYCLGLIINTE